MPDCNIVFGFNPNVADQLAEIRTESQGPEDFALLVPEVLDENNRVVRVLKHGQKFRVRTKLIYLEKVGDLTPDVIFNLTLMDMASCTPHPPFCASITCKLECDTTEGEVTFEFECTQEKAVYSGVIVVTVGKSDLLDFHCFDFCFACSPKCSHEEAPLTTRSRLTNPTR